MSSLNITSLQLAANNFNYIAMMFVRCYCYVAIPFGAVGHALSIYVFTRSSLRSNPCTRYFLAATAFGILNTFYNVPMRLIQAGLVDADPGAYSVVFCKITWFLLFSIRGLAFWFIVLACGDRYLCSSSSTGWRAWSSIRVANRVIPLFILIGFVAYVHVSIFFNITIIAATGKPICYPQGPPGTYRIFISYYNLIFFGLSPPFCMLIFGVLTLRNIDRSKRLIMPSYNMENTKNQNTQRSNRNMLRMLLVQVLVYSVTGLAYSIPSIIIATKFSQTTNVFQVAQNNLINAIAGMLSNTGPCFSFYLFTLSSGLFRKELKNLFRKLFRIGNQPQHVHNYASHTDHIRKMVTTKC